VVLNEKIKPANETLLGDDDRVLQHHFGGQFESSFAIAADAAITLAAPALFNTLATD
jgi:hypothetical protein